MMGQVGEQQREHDENKHDSLSLSLSLTLHFMDKSLYVKLDFAEAISNVFFQFLKGSYNLFFK